VAIANVAGPSIRSGLHASGGQLELVVSGYTLAFAVLLVTCARLGQARGYRRMFLAGLAGFTLASLACALAPSATILVIARIAAGATAALMSAQVLTGIQLGFGGRLRARALGLYSLVLSAGAVAGPGVTCPPIRGRRAAGCGWIWPGSRSCRRRWCSWSSR
jgi:MFS family permease